LKRLLLAGLYVAVLSHAAITTSYSVSGNVAATVVAYPTPFFPDPGVLVLRGLPEDATVLKAYLYAHNYFADYGATATFAGHPLGAATGIGNEESFWAYRWDVTALVTGNRVYRASYTGPDNTYGLALAVVYSDPSLPAAQVFINDGAYDLHDAQTHSTVFNVATAGSGRLWVHTAADDDLSSGEQVTFNGTVVGGPLDGNLGQYASVLSMRVTTVAGTNTASITTAGDQFGWDLAVLQVTAIPEPSSIALAAMGFALLGLYRLHHKR
jgi:hypothetical protein